MFFEKTQLAGAYVIRQDHRSDARGSFARAFCAREFHEHGLVSSFVQANVGSSLFQGTIRGMHYQIAPHQEAKLLMCIKGRIFDVMVDMREESRTYLDWFGIELDQESGVLIYVPPGFAHGYLSLVNDSRVYYQVSAFYTPDSERGFRWDDPAVGIEWPLDIRIISDKDRSWPLLKKGVVV